MAIVPTTNLTPSLPCPQGVTTQNSDLLSTENKVHCLIVLGRVLQTAALLGTAAVITAAVLINPIALVGLVGVVASGLLGSHLTGDLDNIRHPFVPGQPVGMLNGGQNCWANAGLQFLFNAPEYQSAINQVPALLELKNRYEASRSASKKILIHDAAQVMREFLHGRTNGDISSNRSIPEDPADLLNFVLSEANAVYSLQQRTGTNPPERRIEPMIQIPLFGTQGVPFQDLFNRYFESQTDQGVRQSLVFNETPNSLCIQARRFYQYQDDQNNYHSGKVNDPLDVSEKLTLQGRFTQSGTVSAYTCDAFIVHSGASHTGGHYVFYVKKGNDWWYCSDTTVYTVEASVAQNAMKNGYIFHYRRDSN